ncbi:MAG: DEAD/DEAH box helicase [Planctomycetes bacterium]|nr:DEAD/DEAH box helicase [Planctomycetota bacterium]
MPSFSEYTLLPSLLSTLAKQGLKEPTEIQASTIPPQLKGRSVVGVSETGSGKTLAYVLPVLHELKTLETEGDPVSAAGRPRALVLTPGRELGEQVCKVFKGLTHDTRLRVRSVLGGTTKQIARQNVGGLFEVLVATPGRLVQFLDSGQLRLDDVRVLVLDEADQLLDPGFLPTAQRVVRESPPQARLAMFAATLPESLDGPLGELFATEPLRVRTRGSRHGVSTLRTDNQTVSNGKRFELLREVLLKDSSTGTLLFANTRGQCERLAEWLKDEGYAHASYMGQMESKERRANLAAFRSGEVNLLVATDLGGRGLDIDRIDRVINVHLPKDLDNYRHRSGRTARAGRSGLVVNLVTERDLPLIANLKKREDGRG